MLATPTAVIRDPSRRCRFMRRRPAAQSGRDPERPGAARVIAMALEAATKPAGGRDEAPAGMVAENRSLQPVSLAANPDDIAAGVEQSALSYCFGSLTATPNAVIRDPSRRCRFMGRRPAARSGGGQKPAGG